MEFITAMKEVLLGTIKSVLAEGAVDCAAESLRALEQGVHRLLQEVGQPVLTGWLAWQEPRYPAELDECACGSGRR